MMYWSKKSRGVILLATLINIFTGVNSAALPHTALQARSYAGSGIGLGDLIYTIIDYLGDANAYDEDMDDRCILAIGTWRGGSCTGTIRCGSGLSHRQVGPWNACYLNGRNNLYDEDLGNFVITYTQAGGVNSNQDGLHHPVIEIEGFGGSLEIQPLAEAYNEDGGNICEHMRTSNEGVGFTCGFPKKGGATLFGMSIIPDDDPAPGFTPGWCTAHINQYQRNQLRTGANYRFDVIMYDGAGKQIGHVQRAEVDGNGNLGISSRLPYLLVLHSGALDQDYVRFDYAGQSWSCDASDGGTHGCTLGNGQEYGYENGDREGDMGWSCDVAPPVIQPGGKFLIVGDSITHGMTGDWTWRYRLWSWLKQNYDVTFLGPYRGTHGQTPRSAVYPTPPKFPGEATTTTPDIQGPYAGAVSSEFSLSGHGGYWGRQAAQVRYDIKGWVAAYQPQYLLILLGFNDLGWFVSGPEGLIGNMGALVQAAREGKPDVKILIGNVVDREFIEGRQDLVDNTARYNQLLKTTMPNWFRWESPLTYVDVNSNYNCRPGGCPDGYDGLHPNALGEWHIAEAFARSLRNDWGFAASTFSVPAAIDGRVVNPPGGLSCTANQEGNYVFWDADSQARGYEIRTRIQGMTDWWSSGAVYPSTTASFSSWVLEGQTWEYQVLTKGNAQDRSAWSGSVFCTAHPKTAPPPTEITSAPSGDGIQFNWKAVAGYNVNRYSIIVWDRDTEGAFFNMVAANCCGAFVGGLVAGHRYSIWMITHVNMVSSWTGAAEIVGGIPGGAREVIVGGGVPLAVTGLKVVNTEPTTIKLSWNIATGASAGYAIYYRSIRAGAETAQALAGTTTSTTYEIGFLWPGTWYYEFCVSAYNGNLESAKPCVVPPVYPGFRKRDFAGGNSTTILNGTAVANVTVSMADNMALRELFNSMYHNETALTMGVAPARNTTL